MIPFRARTRQARQQSNPNLTELEETTLDLAPGEYEVVSGILGTEEPTELSLTDCQIVADTVTASTSSTSVSAGRSRQSTFAHILDVELEKSLSLPPPPPSSAPIRAYAPHGWDARPTPTPMPLARESAPVATKSPAPQPRQPEQQPTRARRFVLPLVTMVVVAALAGGLLRVEVQSGRLARMAHAAAAFVAR